MANYRLRATGNTSSLSVWFNITLNANAVTLPTSGDVCYANGFTGTIDYDMNLGFGYFSTEANAGLSVSAGGSWTHSGSTRNITGDFKAGTTTCFTQSVIGSTVNHIGKCLGGTSANAFGYSQTGASSLANNTGDCNGGSATSSVGFISTASGAVNIITGDCNGGSGATSYGYNHQATITTTHNGNAIGGNNATGYGVGITNVANSTYTCTGQARSGIGGHGIFMSVAATVRVHSVYNNVSTLIFAISNTGGSTVIIDEKDDTGEYPTVSSKRRYSNTSQTLKGTKENGTSFTLTSSGADYPPTDKVELNYVYANGTYTGTKDYNIDVAALTQAITDIQTANSDLQTVKTDLQNVDSDLQDRVTELQDVTTSIEDAEEQMITNVIEASNAAVGGIQDKINQLEVVVG